MFVLANKAGEPLQQVDQRTNQPTLAVFADLFRAEAELANANRLYPDLGLGLLPIGLGDAFARAQAGGAQLIASQNELGRPGWIQKPTPRSCLSLAAPN